MVAISFQNGGSCSGSPSVSSPARAVEGGQWLSRKRRTAVASATCSSRMAMLIEGLLGEGLVRRSGQLEEAPVAGGGRSGPLGPGFHHGAGRRPAPGVVDV